MTVWISSGFLIREGIRAFLLLLLGLFSSSFAKADDRSLVELLEPPILSENSKNEIYRRAMDNPRILYRQLHNLWNQPSAGQDKLLRARLAWVITRFWYDELQEDLPWDIEAIFRDTLTLLEQDDIALAIDEIRFYKFEYEIGKQPNLLEDGKDEIIRLARHLQDSRFKAYALSKLAFYYAERGLHDKELPILLHDVRVLTSQQKSIKSAIDMDTFSALSLTLETLEQTREAKAIDHMLDAACDAMIMRNHCSLRAYNQGRKLLALEDAERIPEAKAYFLKALDLAQQIEEKSTIGQSYYGLNLAHNASKDYKEAIPYGRKAAELFEQMGSRDWAASALTHLSMSFLKDGQLNEALIAAQHALKICPPEFKDDQLKIYRQLTQIYESLGQFDEAFKTLRMSVELDQSFRREDAQKDYLELRNQSLFEQNELQEQQIRLLQKFRIVSFLAAGLTLVVCLALALVWRQSSALRKSRQKTKDILDHIDEGIVILDSHLLIQNGYSPYLHRIFGHVDQSFHNMALLELLFPADSDQADQKILVKETLLSCMGEQSLTWEFNQGHLPHEIKHQDMIIEVHWQPLYNSQRHIGSYLVTIRDISSLKRMQEDMEQKSRRVKSLQKNLEEILKGNSILIRTLLKELQEAWDHLGQQIFLRDQQASVLRRLHTWKGSARSLGLSDLASGLHALESSLVAFDFEQRLPVENAWKALSLSFEDYQHLLNTLLVSQKAEALAPTNLYSFADIYAREMRNRLGAVLCPQFGVMVLDHVDLWNSEILLRIHEMILHALANALDHGFIRPLQNQRKVQPAMIQILASISADQLLVQVQDNGVGLDWETLKKKAKELAFVPTGNQSLADVLFLDGVSTAKSLTETSGRGIGLSSVRSLCQELGGRTYLDDNPSGGAVLRMEFPLSVLLASAA